MAHRSLDVQSLGAMASMFVVCDRQLRVEMLGPGWAKVMPTLDGHVTLGDLLRVSRPQAPLEFEELLRRGRTGLLSRVNSSGLPIHGPVVPSPPDGLVYLASPRVTTATDVETFGLTLSDLPEADRDFLFALQLKDSAIAEAERAALALTTQRRREQEVSQAMAAQFAVTRVLADARDLEAAAAPLIEALCNVVGWVCGALWRLDRRTGDRLYCVNTWTRRGGPIAFAEESRRFTFARGVGLPGRVWEAGHPIWVTDVTTDPTFLRAGAAVAAGLHAACALPIIVAGSDGRPEVAGVIEAFGQQPRKQDERVIGVMASIGSQVGQFLERRQSEAALRDSEERTRLIVDSALDAVVTMDRRGVIREWNPQAERTFGWTKAEAVGRELASLIVPERLRAAHEAGLKRHQATGRSDVLGNRIEMPAVDRNGREFTVELSIAPIYRDRTRGDGGVGPVLYAGFLRDVTARLDADRALRRAKEEAEAAAAAKADFLATMSHEIRTPMNAIIGLAGLLMDAELPATERAYVTTVRDAGESLLTIINDILDFSKVEAGRLELERIPFSPAELAEEVAELFRPMAAGKSLDIRVQTSPDLPEGVVADPGRLRQVLSNLVSNAVKFTSAGHVSVTADATGGDDRILLRYIVSDTGIGIAPEVLPHLFQAFTQADTSMSRRYGGTGLGLAISDRLARLMGGHVSVTSTLGEGTTFFVVVPVERVSAVQRQTVQHAPVLAAPLQPGSAPRARALIVEDNPANQMVATALLRRLGVLADQASNGREALDAVARAPYDVILMDCQMPEMDGYTASRELRRLATPDQRRIPILAMTANALAGERERCLAAGMDDYLAKPVRLAELADALSRWVPALSAEPAPVSPPAPTPVAPVASSSPTRDRSLQELLGDDWAETLQVYATHSRETLVGMVEAAAKPDGPALERLTHLLRGGSAMLGAVDVERLSADLEADAKRSVASGDWPARVRAISDAVEAFVARSEPQLH